jgi:HD-GYP domain-containing protein (c-di-GMP phosphodiesterase class II)
VQGDIALSGVIGALSYALDITEGQPEGHALRSCAIGMRIAQELALPGAVRSDLFYALLLKDAGCSANAERMAALFGADDRDAKRTSKLVDWSSPWQSLRWSLRTVAPGGSVRERVARLQGIRDEGEVTRKLLEARCDRGAEVARMLYLSEETASAIRSLDEHWDGRGQPDGLAGEEIPLLARILCLAQTAEIFHAAGGVKAARKVAERRRGRWFDPVLVDALEAICRDCDFWASLGEADVANWEPSDRVLRADDERIDRIAEAFARVIDAKSPFTASHSVRVAEIAVGIGELLGFDPVVQRDLRRAGLLHDIGKLAISNRILDKPGKLTDDEFVTIQEHPAYSLRVLHHERIDGTGYPRGLAGEALDLPMRVLAVADVYEALTADRPYRGPMPVEKALDIVSWDVPGRLDRAAFGALEAWLGRSTEPAAAGAPLAPVAPAPDPLAPGVLTLGVPASGVPAQHLSAGPAAPETRPVVPPSGAPCV